MLQNTTALFLRPSNTLPKTYTSEFLTPCYFVSKSQGSILFGASTAVAYDYELSAIIGQGYRRQINTEWRINIEGIEYIIRDCRQVVTPDGYSHSIYGLVKYSR